MKDKPIDPKIEHALEELRSIPRRDPAAAARGKANFLKQASVMRSAVSRKQEARHIGWINKLIPAFPRKERTPVFNTLIAIVLAAAVFFGGTVTVHASQGSLPDQPLYPLKLWIEDAALSLANSPREQISYTLSFSERRVAEMAGLISSGDPVPEKVQARLQSELDMALQLAAGMDDPQMEQQLSQIRLRAENALQTTNALMAAAPEADRPVLLRVYTRLQEQVQLCAMGEADPDGFRLQVQQRHRIQNGAGGQTSTPGSPQGPGPLNATGTPESNGSGYGPGNGSQGSGTQTPGGNGPTPGGSQSTGTMGQYGPGPQSQQSTQQPDSGSGRKP